LKYLPTKLPDGYEIWHLERHPASRSYQESAGREIIPKLFTGVAMGSSLDTSYDGQALQFWAEDALWPGPPSGAVIQFAADGSDQEYFVVDDGGLQIRWERDGNTLSLSGDLTADVLIDIAASIRPVTNSEWATALDTLATRLTDGRSPLDEGLAGDVTITRYPDDILCGRWPDGLRRCQNLRAGSNRWSMVVERDGGFEAIGSWLTTEPLTTTAGVTVDQVQVGPGRLFHLVLPAAGGLTIDTSDDSGFSVNQEG
jgi:hypothetical protein